MEQYTNNKDEKWLVDLKANIFKRIQKEYESISPIDPVKIVEDVFNMERIREQVDRLESEIGPLKKQKILEIGSGYGQFMVEAYNRGGDVYGIEPSSDGFYGETFDTSKVFASQMGVPDGRVVNAWAEDLPFKDNEFDIVYSSNVMEHVKDPEKVFSEMVRVVKPGGYLHMTVPNYGSFYEGHYVLYWIPYLPKMLARIYVRLWGRDPSFIDTLQFVTYLKIKKWVKKHSLILKPMTYGESLFFERMQNKNVGNWAGLGKIQKLIGVLDRLGLMSLVTWFLYSTKTFTPLVLIAKKK